MLADGEDDREAEEDGLRLPEGDNDPLGLNDALTDGVLLTEADGLTLAEGDSEPDGLGLLEAEELGEVEDDGDTEAKYSPSMFFVCIHSRSLG